MACLWRRRYELLKGAFVVSPWPTTLHQSIVARLATLLDRACPQNLCVLAAPALSIDPLTEFVPDVVVVWTDSAARVDNLRTAKPEVRDRGEEHGSGHRRSAIPGDHQSG
jgi:Uma2 family endonuclease